MLGPAAPKHCLTVEIVKDRVRVIKVAKGLGNPQNTCAWTLQNQQIKTLVQGGPPTSCKGSCNPYKWPKIHV